MALKKDKEGQRFGKLIVIERVGKVGNGKAIYKCVCDCGKEVIRRGDNLQTGDTKSCGCYKIEFIRNLGFENRKFSKEDTSWRDLYDHYKSGARKRELDFQISHEDLKRTCQQNCYLCNKPPSERKGRIKHGTPIITNGLDRLNSDLGYVEGNIAACCFKCNRMKNDTPLNEFLDQCQAILSFYQRD